MEVIGSNSTCGEYFVLQTWMEYSLLASIPIAIVFCFLEQRVRLWPSFLNGRPGVAVPVNLIDTYEDRIAFSSAFASIAIIIVQVVLGVDSTDQDPTQPVAVVPEMLQGTLSFLNAIGKALLVCAACSPIMLCLSTEYKLIGNVIGLFYSMIWSAYYFAGFVGCKSVLVKLVEKMVGAWITAPGFVFFFALTIRFLYGIVKVLYRSRCQLSRPQSVQHEGSVSDFTETHFYQRTKYLLTRPLPQENEGNIISRVFRRYIYFVKGFKYSRQNICALTMALFLTYMSGIIFVATFGVLFPLLEQITPVLFQNSDLGGVSVIETIQEVIQVFKVTFWISASIAMVGTAVSSIDAQIRYRRHTLQLWRGDRSFCPAGSISNESIMVNSLRYIGLRIAFTFLGFFVFHLIAWVVCLLLRYLFVMLLTKFWLTGVLFLILGYAQVLMNRLLFMQKDEEQEQSRNFLRRRKTYLALDNKRIFHVVVYFTLFVNIIVGTLKGVFRMIKSIVIGAIVIGRVDRCALQRDWEEMDIGFKAYTSFLQLEVAHTHPVVITFCHFLNESIFQRNLDPPTSDQNVYVVEQGSQQKVSDGPPVFTPKDVTQIHKMSPRVRNRWFLALTLSRNPALILTRTQQRPMEPRRELQVTSSECLDNGHDNLATTEEVSPDHKI